MKHIVPVVLLGAVTMLAAQALAQTQTKPPKTAATNNPAASPAAASQADGDIAQLKDKTLLGYVSAQRLLSPSYQAKFPELAQWLQDYNDHPDAPAIYKLAVARRTPGAAEITPASFVSMSQGSPTFAAARTVRGADAAQAGYLRTKLQSMADDGGFNAAFALLDRKTTVDVLGPPEVEMWRGRMRT